MIVSLFGTRILKYYCTFIIGKSKIVADNCRYNRHLNMSNQDKISRFFKPANSSHGDSKVEGPVKEPSHDVSKTESPPKDTSCGVSKTESLQKDMSHDVSKTESPRKDTSCGVSKTESLQKDMSHDVSKTESSRKDTSHDVSKTGSPRKDTRHDVSKTESPRKDTSCGVSKKVESPRKDTSAGVSKKVENSQKEPSRGVSKKEGPWKETSKKEEFVFFYGQNEVFSQFHKVDFEVNGEQYCCMEQYMHHQKAVTFKDRLRAKAIMETTEPKLHKKLGRQVINFDSGVWARKSVQVVREGNIEKFGQNEKLREIMFSTYPKTLVEASPRDRLWGIGMGRHNENATNRSKWRGKNLLGKTLTEVRGILLKKFNVDPETAANMPELDIKIPPIKSTPSKRTTKAKTPIKKMPTKKTPTKKTPTKKTPQKRPTDSLKGEQVETPAIETKTTPKKDIPTPNAKISSSKKRKEPSDDSEAVSPKKRKAI